VAVIWSAVLLVGASIFLTYFVEVGFMPEMDLSGSVAFLAAVALVGVGSFFGLGLMLVYPGWFWRVTDQRKSLKSRWWFVWFSSVAVSTLFLGLMAEAPPPYRWSWWWMILASVLGLVLSVLLTACFREGTTESKPTRAVSA
jgi:hypothetical protein